MRDGELAEEKGAAEVDVQDVVPVFDGQIDDSVWYVECHLTAAGCAVIDKQTAFRGGLLLLVASFCTTWIAGVWRIQILSFLIAGISVLQLWQLKRVKQLI